MLFGNQKVISINGSSITNPVMKMGFLPNLSLKYKKKKKERNEKKWKKKTNTKTTVYVIRHWNCAHVSNKLRRKYA